MRSILFISSLALLLLDCQLDAHFVNLLETKLENSRFARVDSDTIDRLIAKEEAEKPELSEDAKKALDEAVKSVMPEGNDYYVEAENLGESNDAVLITQNEFMRRYREMSSMGGGLNFYGQMPESYNVVVNMEHPLVKQLVEGNYEDKELLRHLADLHLQRTAFVLDLEFSVLGKFFVSDYHLFAPFHYIFQNRRSIALENRLCLRTDFQILSPFRGELRMNLYVYCASPVREYRRNRYSGRAILAPTNSFKCAGKAFAPIQNNSCALTTPQSAYGCQLPLRRGANGAGCACE